MCEKSWISRLRSPEFNRAPHEHHSLTPNLSIYVMSIDRPISDRSQSQIQNALSMLYLRVISENNVFSAWVSRTYKDLDQIQHFGFSAFRAKTLFLLNFTACHHMLASSDNKRSSSVTSWWLTILCISGIDIPADR